MIYCIEPLSRDQTAFVNTVAEAAEIVRQIDSPAVRTMIDCSAAGAGRERSRSTTGAALAADRPDRAHPFQRSEPARAGRRRARVRPDPRGAARRRLSRAMRRSSRSSTSRTGRPARRAASAISAASCKRYPHDQRLRLIAADFFERPVQLRLPFRFGAVTLTRSAAGVRARAHQAGRRPRGRRRLGRNAGAEMVRQVAGPDERAEFRPAAPLARAWRASALLAAGTRHAVRPLRRGRRSASRGLREGRSERTGRVVRAGADRARDHRCARAARGRSVFSLVRDNRLGLDAATAPDLAGFDFGKFLASLAPATSILRATPSGWSSLDARRDSIRHSGSTTDCRRASKRSSPPTATAISS